VMSVFSPFYVCFYCCFQIIQNMHQPVNIRVIVDGQGAERPNPWLQSRTKFAVSP